MEEKALRKAPARDLVARLKLVFRGLTPEEIDDAVAIAKKQAIAQTAAVTNDLNQLFDNQIETLKKRGCPQIILKILCDQRKIVISKAAKMEIPEDNIPFIPVIPQVYMGIYALMPMIRNKQNLGYTFFNPNLIVNNIATPLHPYFIYDIEDGRNTLGKSPQKAKEVIKEQERCSLTVDEVIALCVHTNVLSRHYVHCLDSIYSDSPNNIIAIKLFEGKPMLTTTSLNEPDDKYGSASCRTRTLYLP